MRARLSYCVLYVLIVTIAGCSPVSRGTSQAVPLQPTAFIPLTATVHTVQLLTATPQVQQQTTSTVQPEPFNTQAPWEPALPGQWVEIRDSQYGFGLALPCWWNYTPIPAGAQGGAMTVRSYDDAYFFANSIKGWWTAGDWPDGAVKVDLIAWNGFEPSLSTLEAFDTTFDHASSQIVSANEVRIAENQAWLVEMRDLVNTDAPTSRLYLFRLDPDTLLMVSAAPDRALDSSDVQSMLRSLVLSPDQPVHLPQVAPSPAIISLPAECPAQQ